MWRTSEGFDHTDLDDVFDGPNGGKYTRRYGPLTTVTKTDDPAYALLTNPAVFSTPNDSIFDPRCYICCDPEFAQMGLPLCYACPECGGHIAADDGTCRTCG